jgi:hypothetical protein
LTQSLFPRIFPGVCPYCVCFIELQGHCIFGQCTDTKVQGAPAQTVGLHNPHGCDFRDCIRWCFADPAIAAAFASEFAPQTKEAAN